MLLLSFSGICFVCGKYKATLKKHLMSIHSKGDVFYCDLCPKTFVEKFKLKYHIINRHIFKLPPLPSRPIINCSICGCEFRTHGDRMQHNETWHMDYKKLTCLKCGKVFTLDVDLRKHLEWHTKIVERTEGGQCDICGRFLCDRAQMELHKLRIHGSREFDCTFENCKKNYATQKDLDKHIEVHTGQRSKKIKHCTFPGCGKPFLHPSKLRMHYAIVHENYALGCPVEGCYFSVGRKDHMRKHILKTHNLNEVDRQYYLELAKGLKFTYVPKMVK